MQGYDLNYAGVIIGRDLRADAATGRLVFSRDEYKDKMGKMNNRKLDIKYSDEDLLQYVLNIYSVLLTRGMLGTYVYVCDTEVRERLRRFLLRTDDMALTSPRSVAICSIVLSPQRKHHDAKWRHSAGPRYRHSVFRHVERVPGMSRLSCLQAGEMLEPWHLQDLSNTRGLCEGAPRSDE